MVRWFALLASLLAVPNVNAQNENQTAFLGNMSQGTFSLTSPATEMALQRATEMAKASSHETPTLEHVLIALLDDEAVIELLANQNVEPDVLRASLLYHLDEIDAEPQEANRPSVDPSLQNVMRRAVMENMASNRKDLSPADILVAILIEGDSFAGSVLGEHGLTVEEAENESLNRYLADAAKQARNLEDMRERIARESAGSSNQVGSVSISSGSFSEPAVGPRPYTLRVTSERGGEETEFKAAVSHDGRLDLYIETTPFETDFIASRVAALFESIEVDGSLKVELVAEIEGQRRAVSGFSGTAGAIFDDWRNPAMQRSGTLKRKDPTAAKGQ